MSDFCSPIQIQIRLLLQSFNEANADAVNRELRQIVDREIEGSIVMLQTCSDHIYFHRTEFRNMQLDTDMVSIFTYILEKPNFSTIFCESIKNTEFSEGFLQKFSSSLQLSTTAKIGIGLALSDSEDPDARFCGETFCMHQIEELCANGCSQNSTKQLQNIVMFLQRSKGLSKHVDHLMQMLSLMEQKNDANSFVLTPLLAEEIHDANILRVNSFDEGQEDEFGAIYSEMVEKMSMGDLLKELGYGCTIDISHCKEILSLFLPLTAITISKILGTVAQTYSGLDYNQSTFSTFEIALGCSVSSDQMSFSSWNIDVLVNTIKQLAPNTNWIQVIEELDHEGFYMPNEDAFGFFMSVYKLACQHPFPLHAICGSLWKNTQGQLSFLENAVKAPPEIFNFGHSARQLAYMDAVHDHKLEFSHTNHAWLCIDLLDVLCQLAERGHASSVRSILENPIRDCPKVLLLGMAHTSTAYNLIQSEVCFSVIPMVIKNGMPNDMLLYLWNINPNLVLRGFVDAYNIDPDSITKILDICQELKIMSTVLERIPSPCGIRLAAFASEKELVDLEEWLSYNLVTYKDFFFKECLKFLREIQLIGEHNLSAKSSQRSTAIIDVHVETSSTFSKVLKAHIGLTSSSQISDEIERLPASTVDSTPKLQNGGGAADSSSDGYADAIEGEANSYFQQMFSGQLSIDVMVQMLAKFKDSSNTREQSIFDCMINNLFEEYQFFPKYPDKQLTIAALLFGSVIKHQLVTHLTLGVALRFVLDALRKPADSKMFQFGVKALDQFLDRLMEWPQYCNHILQISHLRSTHSGIVGFIELGLARISSGHFELDGGGNLSPSEYHGFLSATSGHGEMNTAPLMQSGQQAASLLQPEKKHEASPGDNLKGAAPSSNDMKPPLSSGGQSFFAPLSDASATHKIQNASGASAMLSSNPGFVRPSRGGSSTRFGSALNIETLVAAAERRETPIEAPASETQDRISFIINNISATNVETKAKDLTEILKEQYYSWFAQYMVMKRASIEPNFHDLYLKFLDKINSKGLNREIRQATYENCKVLLGSELIKSSSEERSLLKNLGSWLGKLTIGRNQVLRAREIDPKSLVIEAYEKGLMIAVIPFTSKILEPCQSSTAYRPPNPWTMGILGLLAEIYSMPNLKMNLKFDIEVLFKNLAVDLNKIAPSSLLKDRRREAEGNPDFSTKDVGTPQTQPGGEVKSGMISQLNHGEPPLEVVGSPNSGVHTHLLPQYAAPLHLSSATLLEDEKLAALGLSDQISSAQALFQTTPTQSTFSVSQVPTPIPNIGNHVVINQKLNVLGLHAHFQRVVPIALERSFKEIVSGIVQRSVSIATQTTKELVLKDYAMELDETRIYNAAHLMIACLAGSLAHVTCKEPLRGSISSHLRNSLQNLRVLEPNDIDDAVQLVTNDNLDLGCAFIEQAATEKAIQTIDAEITQQLSLRRKQSIPPTFFDATVYPQGSTGVVPEALCPKPGRLSLSQQRVYEDFVRLPWQNQSIQSMSAGSSTSSCSAALTSAYGSSSGNSGALSGPGNPGFEPVARHLDGTSEAIELNSAALHSASSVRSGAADGAIQQSSEIPVGASFPSSGSAFELQSVESSDATKEPCVSSPPPSHSGLERIGRSISELSLPTRDALEKYQIVAQKLETLIDNEAREIEVQGVVAEVTEIILRCINRDDAALAVAQKVFNGVYENASNKSHSNALLAILVALHDVCKLVVKELTSWVIYSEDERKFNKIITLGLIRYELLNLAEYNVHMAKLIDGGRNKGAMEFSVSLLQMLVIEEPSVISELPNLVDALAKVAGKPGSPESLKQLIEIARNPVGNVAALSGLIAGKEDKARQPRDKKATGHPTHMRDEHSNLESLESDTAGFREMASSVFRGWYKICELHGTNDAACSHFILGLHQDGLLNGDDITDRFFRILMELSVAHCLASEIINSGTLHAPQQGQTLSFLAIDTYAKFVFSILKYCPVDQGSSKLSLLSKILGVTVRFIQDDSEEKKASFHPIPYFRLFVNWILDLVSLDPVTDGSNFQVLTAFSNAFHALQPLKVPGFSFAWLELVSHKSFLPKLLTGNSQKGWPHVQRLLVDLFQFLEPFLRNADLRPPVRLVYKGTLRVLLVLLHDIPEFLCDFHFTFCDVIPPSCIQMRNIILSAFPRNMRLPDPSTPNLKIDLLPEIREPPHILSEVDVALKAKQMKADLEEYLKTRSRERGSFLTELRQKLLLSPSEATGAGTHYNVPLINSLVLYAGMQAIQQMQAKAPHTQSSNTVPLANFLVDASLDLYQTLISELDTEGRYLFLNAVCNQLRYPNNHTHYFSFVVLYLFAESNQEIIQEQITRVLLERLIVNRPHPWGLLITFIELIKNPRYNFWNRSFIRCAPAIEKLFDSVARSCGSLKPIDESIVSGWAPENVLH